MIIMKGGKSSGTIIYELVYSVRFAEERSVENVF